jgi:hypothetical protein
LNKQLLKTNFLITDNFQIKSTNPISGDNASYYPSNQTGVVVNKIFERIDKTKSKKIFINSSFFINNDTLFRVGGYGFWTKYRGLSYFNINDNVWYPYQLNAVDNSYHGLLNPKISRVNNTSYILYAGKTFDDKNPLEEYPNFKAYVLDFKSKSIVYSGKTKQILDGPRLITFQDNTLILKKTGIERLDWSSNIVEFFNCNWTHKVSQKHNIFLINDQFYFIQEVDNEFILTSLFNNIDSLITQKKVLYESKKMSKLIYLLIVLIVIGVLYFLNKKYNTPICTS